MHTRFTRAAVDEPSEDPIFGPLMPEEAFEDRRLRILWARRRLGLDGPGRRTAVAVALDGSIFLVRIVDALKGSACWQPVDKVLSSAQLRSWIGHDGFDE